MTDPLAALRQLVAGMTLGEWMLSEKQVVAGSRALRLLADEATVEGVARALDPLAFDETRAGYHVWKGKRNATMQKAQLVIAHLAAQIVKEPQP